MGLFGKKERYDDDEYDDRPRRREVPRRRRDEEDEYDEPRPRRREEPRSNIRRNMFIFAGLVLLLTLFYASVTNYYEQAVVPSNKATMNLLRTLLEFALWFTLVNYIVIQFRDIIGEALGVIQQLIRQQAQPQIPPRRDEPRTRQEAPVEERNNEPEAPRSALDELSKVFEEK